MTQRILIGFPEEMVGDMDKYCQENKYDRSEFVRAAIREKLYYKEEVDSRKGSIPQIREVRDLDPGPIVGDINVNAGRDVPSIEEEVRSKQSMIWEHPSTGELLYKEAEKIAFCTVLKGHGYDKKERKLFYVTVLTSEDQEYYKGLVCRECIDWFANQIKSQGGRIE